MVLALPYFKGGFLTNTEMNEITPWLWFWHKTPGSFFWVNVLFSYKWGIVHFSQCAKKSCRLPKNYGVFEFFILVNFGIQPCMPPPPRPLSSTLQSVHRRLAVLGPGPSQRLRLRQWAGGCDRHQRAAARPPSGPGSVPCAAGWDGRRCAFPLETDGGGVGKGGVVAEELEKK